MSLFYFNGSRWRWEALAISNCHNGVDGKHLQTWVIRQPNGWPHGRLVWIATISINRGLGYHSTLLDCWVVYQASISSTILSVVLELLMYQQIMGRPYALCALCIDALGAHTQEAILAKVVTLFFALGRRLQNLACALVNME